MKVFRAIALTVFLLGSALFWYAIYLRHFHKNSEDLAETIQSSGLLLVALALVIVVWQKRRGPKS